LGDGNPYWIADSGEKHYAYHPYHEKIARCVGYDSPHLCLSCGKEFQVVFPTDYPLEFLCNSPWVWIEESLVCAGPTCIIRAFVVCRPS